MEDQTHADCQLVWMILSTLVERVSCGPLECPHTPDELVHVGGINACHKLPLMLVGSLQRLVELVQTPPEAHGS